MKSLKFKSFSLFLGFAATTASANPTLPAHDPYPTQPEATAEEVQSITRPGVAVPAENSSYFSVAGFAENRGDSDEPAPAPKRGDAALEFCHSDQWSTACLMGLLVYRCAQYTFPLTPYGCALASTAFVASLEMKRINVVVDGTSYSLPVIFTERLERFMQDRSTQADLSSLRALLVSAAKNKQHFDLYQWAITVSKGNLDETLERLAVILQDTSAVEIQINYLKGVAKARSFNSAAMQAISDLEEIVYQLNFEVVRDEGGLAWLKLYPPIKNIEADTTPLIYHFYPMAFTARLLQRAGFGDRLSSFLPFLFNTEYLSQTLDPVEWPIHHPSPFKLTPANSWAMHDMYSGYAGAHWGVQKSGSLVGLARFENEYSQAPYLTMRHLFWSMPNP